MKHLRTDWQGIQDVRQWLIAELMGLEATIIGEDTDAAQDEVAALIVRLTQLTGDPEDEACGPASSIEDDEPVFLIRAKDPVSGSTVRYWSELARDEGSADAYVDRVAKWADEMEAYRIAHWGASHAPDAPALLPEP